jgi:hypothetical protein
MRSSVVSQVIPLMPEAMDICGYWILTVFWAFVKPMHAGNTRATRSK